MNVFFDSIFAAVENRILTNFMRDKSTGIPLSKNYNFMSVRSSCKSSQRFSERNRFPTSLM